ncbi:MAG: DUF2341 domain-containing protein, partial [Nanoarchaeota archaeon]|nr:DUF2341 domain-containing protein [Nanoarchaeota archaeon]
DGGDYISVTDSLVLRLGTKQTIELWVRIDGTPGDWTRMLGKGASGTRNYGLWRETDGDILYQIYGSATCNFYDNGGPGSDDNIAAGSGWRHVVATYDGTTGRVYIDGIEVHYSNCGTTPFTSADPLTIGYATFHTYMMGAVEEIRVSNVTRTADWINQSYQLIENQNLFIGFGEEEDSDKGIIPITPGDIPFWTNSENPKTGGDTSCLYGMNASDSCQVTWNVNATGDFNLTYEFFTIFAPVNYSAYLIPNITKIINVLITQDDMPPVISNVQLTAPPNIINKIINITARVTDETQVSSVRAIITLPNSTIRTFTMSDSDFDSIYNLTFIETSVLGGYNITLSANDTTNKMTTYSSNFTVELDSLDLTIDSDEYVEGETVYIYSTGYLPFVGVTVTILDPTSDPVTGFPKNYTSNSTGGINLTWTVALGSQIGEYTLNATETVNTSRSASRTFEVVSAIVTTDFSAYMQGGTVVISGYKWDPTVNVTINITNPLNQTVYGPVNLYSNSTGAINTTWQIPFNASAGLYSLTAIEKDNPAKNDGTTFTVTKSTVLASTDYPWYKEGETINILGYGFSFDTNITFDIMDSGWYSIFGYPKNFTSNATGYINHSLTATGLVEDAYSITIIDDVYGDLNANTSFGFVKAEIVSSQETYNDGETAYLTGNYWDRGEKVTIDIINETGQSETSYPMNVTANSTGGFVHEWTARAIGVSISVYNVSAYQPSDPAENASANFSVVRTAEIRTDKTYYAQLEDVNITGSLFSPYNFITLRLLNMDNGGIVLNYPKIIPTDVNGDISHTFAADLYCGGNYTVIGTDNNYPEQLNASADFIIRGWWNSSWKKRKPIYINNSLYQDLSDFYTKVNVTGLNGEITSCKNQTRLISTITSQEIEFDVISGDDSDYCEISFAANVSGFAVNEVNYYFYYNNTQAKSPDYSPLYDWYNVSWNARKKFTINKLLVHGSHIDFPVLINISDPDLSKAEDNGSDILFTSSDGRTKLSHEIEYFNRSTNDLVAWVKINVSSAEDSIIYMYYDNPGVPSQSDGENVWDDNYIAVFHELEELAIDSTANSHYAISRVEDVDIIGGYISNGANFDGDSGYQRFSGFADLGTANKPYTIRTLVNVDIGESQGNIIHMSGEIGGGGWCLPPLAYTGSAFRARSWNGGAVDATSTTNPTQGVWYQVVTTWDSTNGIRIFVNGVNEQSTPMATYSASGGANYLHPAFQPSGCSGNVGWFDGSIDEIRVSNIARTPAYINTSYQTEFNSAEFISEGPEEVPMINTTAGAAQEYFICIEAD